MSATYLAVNLHVIFSTKHRKPMLQGQLQERTHAYIGGIINKSGATAIEVGGVEDHVHLLIGMKSTQNIAALVKEIKIVSGEWLRSEMKVSSFGWQDGYAAISVSPERLEAVRNYIQRQEEHHRMKTSLDELAELLAYSRIDYDPQYFE